MTTKLRARYGGKVLVPLETVDLPTGKVVDLDVHEPSGLRRGSPELLLKVMHEPPHVSPDDVSEMERMIAESQIASGDESVFGPTK